MIKRRSINTLALTLLVAAAMAACGGASSFASSSKPKSNGVASESVSQILAATTKAADSLKSVTVAGAGDDGATAIGIDLQVEAGVGSQGSITLNGDAVQIKVVHGEVYLYGSSPFWKAASGEAVAQLVAGKWLKAPSTGDFASFAHFGTVSGLFQSLFSSHGTLVKSGTATVAGTVAVGLRDTTKGGTLYIAATGQPYPLEIVNGKKASKVTFTDFNAPVSITAPKNAINLAQLQSGK